VLVDAPSYLSQNNWALRPNLDPRQMRDFLRQSHSWARNEFGAYQSRAEWTHVEQEIRH
jgi:hypothetical protein